MQRVGDRPETANKGYGGSAGQGGVDKKTLIIFIACGVVVSVVAVQFLFLGSYVTKKDFTANIQGMTQTVSQATTDMTQKVTNVQNTMNSLPSSIMGQVSSAISQATSALQNQVNSMTSSMASKSDLNNMASKSYVDGEVAKLEDTIAKLTTRIETLEKAKVDTTTPSSKSVYAELGSNYCVLPSTNATSVTGTLFLELVNDSTQDVDITGIDLVVFPSQLGGITYLSNCKVSSSLILTWSSIPLGSDMFLIQGRPMPYIGSPVLEADDSVSYPMVLSFTLAQPLTDSLSLGIKINDFTYEVSE